MFCYRLTKKIDLLYLGYNIEKGRRPLGRWPFFILSKYCLLVAIFALYPDPQKY